MAWRYIVLTQWGDVLGSNSRDDVDVALRHWAGSKSIDVEAGEMLGDELQAVELLDVTRYRGLSPNVQRGTGP